ncbi:MAG: glycoside hydrolase family 28 protein, partial [Anaerolineae bacterium]|nr:glycoside hydrolase family 28 protein [Anaerolineae bacterium]
NVRISDCSIQAGDDAICVKTTPGFERYGISENITVTGCHLVSTSSALVLGCEVRQTIRNVIFEACVIQSSHRGMSINLSQAGSVENVLFSNIIVETRIFHDDWWGCGEPIYIKASPWTDMDSCGQIRNIRLTNILAHSENGVLVYGWKPGLIDQILFENVHLQLDKWSKWKGGKLDLRPNPGAHNGYNQGVIEHPTSAFMLYNAGSITLRNCQVSWKNKPSYFHHAVQYAQVKDLRLEHFNGEAADPDRYAAIEQSW